MEASFVLFTYIHQWQHACTPSSDYWRLS